jgi:hypothetical protein
LTASISNVHYIASGTVSIPVTSGDVFIFEVKENSASDYLFMELKIQ